jgi:hypothetical protein
MLMGVPALAKAWAPLLSSWGVQLRLTSVFCHQTPKASFKMGSRPVSPELGDLLIVRRHRDGAGAICQCAVLLQAKMAKAPMLALPGSDPQLHLLRHWPTFHLLGVNAPQDEFRVGRVGRQGLYAVIATFRHWPEDNLDWPDGCSWGILSPCVHGEAEMSLAGLLTRLLVFFEGRAFYSPHVTGCDWSRLIHYMLDVTSHLPLRTRDMRHPDWTRGSTLAVLNRSHTTSGGVITGLDLPGVLGAGGGDQVTPSHALEFADGGQGRILIIDTATEDAREKTGE